MTRMLVKRQEFIQHSQMQAKELNFEPVAVPQSDESSQDEAGAAAILTVGLDDKFDGKAHVTTNPGAEKRLRLLHP
ncbi:unnamed protein product [Leptidea sinapis]|uniref:Uncharacterized protein n=1 Tax=Leptidea sinapis TaxID=189913 RepID=A0A5E4QN79_9NEOP|nr:unnamed protein product [Leptidea sinapis]